MPVPAGTGFVVTLDRRVLIDTRALELLPRIRLDMPITALCEPEVRRAPGL